MLRTVISSVALVSMLCLPSLADAQTAADTTNQLQQRYSEWMNAFLRGDGAAMDKLERDDLVLVQYDGAIWRKTQPRAQTEKKRTPPFESKLEDVKAQVTGDTAILTGIDNQVGAGAVRFISVWRNEGGSWKVWATSWTEMPERRVKK